MARESKKVLKNTWGYCEFCEKFYKNNDYVLKFDKILCKSHMDEYEREHPELKNRKWD